VPDQTVRRPANGRAAVSQSRCGALKKPEYLTRIGTYKRYGKAVDDGRANGRGKGQIMLADHWLAVINAEREREIKVAQRVHLLDRNRIEDEPDDASAADVDRSTGPLARRVIQPGRATADPSL
jgi:hypothetical protein